jgi:hypothetical protein
MRVAFLNRNWVVNFWVVTQTRLEFWVTTSGNQPEITPTRFKSTTLFRLVKMEILVR